MSFLTDLKNKIVGAGAGAHDRMSKWEPYENYHSRYWGGGSAPTESRFSETQPFVRQEQQVAEPTNPRMSLQQQRNFLVGDVPERTYVSGKVPELDPKKFLYGEQTAPFTFGGRAGLTVERGLPDMEFREEKLFDRDRWGEDVGPRGRDQPGGGLAGEHYRSLAGFMPDKPERMAGFTPPPKLNIDDILLMYEAQVGGSGGSGGGAAGRPVIPYKHHIDVAAKLTGAMPQFQQAEALPLRWDLPIQPPTAGEPPASPERDRGKYHKLLGI